MKNRGLASYWQGYRDAKSAIELGGLEYAEIVRRECECVNFKGAMQYARGYAAAIRKHLAKIASDDNAWAKYTEIMNVKDC